MLILWVASGHHLPHCRRRAIVQIRGRAPEFDQRWRVEFIGGFVKRTARADIVGMQISEQPRRMTAGTAHSLEERLAPLRRRGKAAVDQPRTGHWLERTLPGARAACGQDADFTAVGRWKTSRMNNAENSFNQSGGRQTMVASRIAGVRNGGDGMKSTRLEDRGWPSGGSRIEAAARGRGWEMKNFLPLPIRTPMAQT
jgi:hypothetical protein